MRFERARDGCLLRSPFLHALSGIIFPSRAENRILNANRGFDDAGLTLSRQWDLGTSEFCISCITKTSLRTIAELLENTGTDFDRNTKLTQPRPLKWGSQGGNRILRKGGQRRVQDGLNLYVKFEVSAEISRVRHNLENADPEARFSKGVPVVDDAMFCL